MTTRFRTRRGNIALGVLLAVAGACSDTNGPGIITHLSAQQATAISSRMDAIGAMGGELSWLSDSANLIISAGAQVERIVVTVDGQPETYYGLGLHRVFPGSPSFATFHFIAFDNPDDPRNFLAANGYVQGGSGVPPSSVSAPFGGINAFAHLIEVANPAATSWAATSGTATFSTVVTNAACSGISLPSTVTCARSSLTVELSVAAAGPPMQPLSATRSAALVSTLVPAITLQFSSGSP